MGIALRSMAWNFLIFSAFSALIFIGSDSDGKTRASALLFAVFFGLSILFRISAKFVPRTH